MRISAITSSEARGGREACFTAAEGRMCGGSAPLVVVLDAGRNKGDAGLSNRENGEGAVGGGRWMSVIVVPFAVVIVCADAWGEVVRGSGKRWGGRSEVPGLGRGYLEVKRAWREREEGFREEEEWGRRVSRCIWLCVCGFLEGVRRRRVWVTGCRNFGCFASGQRWRRLATATRSGNSARRRESCLHRHGRRTSQKILVDCSG